MKPRYDNHRVCAKSRHARFHIYFFDSEIEIRKSIICFYKASACFLLLPHYEPTMGKPISIPNLHYHFVIIFAPKAKIPPK